MIDKEDRIYSEVLGVLMSLGNEYFRVIPSTIIVFLEENCDHTYLPEYDRNTRIEDLDISDEARMFLIMLKIKYWCKDEKERDEVRKLLKENEAKFTQEMREKYDPNKLFKEEDLKEEEIEEKDTTEDKLIKEEKKNWFSRFIDKLRRLFKKS